jgi:hypothetical protein
MNVLICLVGALCIVACTAHVSETYPDQYLPELGKDYVYWRAKTLICAQEGNDAQAQKSRERMRGAERYLFHSNYTEAEAVAAIREAEQYYSQHKVRGCGWFAQ